MLSNKMTFSLLSVVTLLALAFATPYALADGDAKKTHFDLEVTIGAAESLMDVSAKDGLQINSGRNRMSRLLDLDGDAHGDLSGVADALNLILPTADDTITDSDPGDILTLSVRFSHSVNLENPGASLEDLEQATKDRKEEETNPTVGDSGGNFGTDDIYVAAFDLDGRQLGVLPLNATTGIIQADFIDASSPGQNFLVTIHQASLLNAYDNNFEISKLVFFIPKGISGKTDKDLADGADAVVSRGIRKADLSHVISHFAPDAHQHINKASNRFEIDLVDADQGDPQYAKIVGISGAEDVAMDSTEATETDTTADGTMDPGSGTPGVVSIMRTASRAGFIESGDFEVRIILTEEPMGGLTADKIMVANGSVKSVVKGVTYRGGHSMIAAATTNQVAVKARSKRDSELGPEMINYYLAAVDASATLPVTAVFGTPPAATAGIARVPDGTTANNGTVANFPEATGRDNMYHSYIAMISPNPGFDGDVIVSVAAFDDNVLPVPNRYIPVTPEQRDATRLTGWAMYVRDARVMNETLTVRAHTIEDQKVAAAKKGYDARQKVLDAVANEATLGNKLIVPAGGYLVIHAADLGNTGIVDPKSKVKEKVSPASKLYNVTKLGLPFPADDLDNFFRNGGTLNLAYGDIPEATGSGHGDSKEVAAVGHDDDTGYRGATTNVYTAGALIINEIMWGLDAGKKDSQYIELHNPGTAAIGIDNKEWIISVGAVPTGYAVIDSITNNPASGYWAVPGSGGVTTASEVHPALTDLVSMSRITGATDGTDAASWAVSMSPSANLSGRRIGTPGAPNNYVKPVAPPTPPPPPPPAKADVATGADIMISEIMVASNGGRLPQWIELANVSGKDVSLMGWSIDIDNDATDADVVAESVNVELGDVTIGKDQVALVVSKVGRNSGVGTGKGDLRADRIVDVQSQVSPTDARYSLLSEMAFKIALLPPQKGGVVERGDVVGNLGKGWTLEKGEGNRSSLIRREMGKAAAGATAAEIMGTDAAGWVLASNTNLDGAYRTTYYGNDEDEGTPGYNAGGALPVELSKFSAKRDPLTNQVIITWETQSELNNAGFFIKRSQQKDSKFVAINPTMIPGAGTISEKQSYTYTDTTAQPNIVYYYQIEDVSLDGNRQTLTRAHRLKGHVGAAGKLTTIWGELKEQQ